MVNVWNILTARTQANSSPSTGFSDGAKAFAGKACGACPSANSTDANVHIDCDTTLGNYAKSMGLDADLKDQAVRRTLSDMLREQLAGAGTQKPQP